jgi:hypothetical protein
MMSLTKAKAIAKDPEAYSPQELDDPLTVIVESDRLTERQVTRLQALIDPVLRSRTSKPPTRRYEDCTHPAEYQSSDAETNEVLCNHCGWLRDLMTWEEWAKRPIESHLLPMPKDGV